MYDLLVIAEEVQSFNVSTVSLQRNRS